jgi:hypothetical protein
MRTSRWLRASSRRNARSSRSTKSNA